MKIFLTSAVIILLVANVILTGTVLFKTPKIGYVRSQNLIYGYLGMKEAQSRFQEKTNQWQTNTDTLRFDYQKSLSAYQQEYSKLSEKERKERENLLELQKNNVLNYSDAVSKKAKEEEEKMTEGVLNQINAFAEEFGKSEGYDIIFGTTLSGNLLYGNGAMDITDELLAGLNDKYKNK
ncbi:MAG: OmpH family outer membrane protein [Bacteroidetes bacterium]|nr:OmpH family outer membrane protein [Bacteroidota bacterium]